LKEENSTRKGVIDGAAVLVVYLQAGQFITSLYIAKSQYSYGTDSSNLFRNSIALFTFKKSTIIIVMGWNSIYSKHEGHIMKANISESSPRGNPTEVICNKFMNG